MAERNERAKKVKGAGDSVNVSVMSNEFQTIWFYRWFYGVCVCAYSALCSRSAMLPIKIATEIFICCV